MPYPSSVDANQIPETYLGSDAAEASAGGTTNTLTANQVYLIAVKVNGQTTVTGMRVHVGSTATGHTDMGIYDSNGNRLDHTGAVTNTASTTMTNALSNGNLILSPGIYYLAFTNDNGTDTYSRATTLAVPGAMSNFRVATNNASSGVLPTTLGAILAPTGAYPVFSAVTSGGLP
jgi:hypothetical protein